MVCDHMVKVNGRYYQAGENAPEIEGEGGKRSLPPFPDRNIEFEKNTVQKPHTKTDIQRMSKAELLEMAKSTGIEGADNMTGSELKEYLLNAFGL